MSLENFVDLKSQDAARSQLLKVADTRHGSTKTSFREPNAESLRGDSLNSYIEASKVKGLDEFAIEQRVRDYQLKQEARAIHLRDLAEKARQEAERKDELADSIGGALNGTPILVDHYSADKVRRAYDKVHNLTGQAIELRKDAERYEKSAENALNPTAISSDDPEAIKKLKAEIEELEKERSELKNNYVIDQKAQWFQEGSERWRSIRLEGIGRNIRAKEKRIKELGITQAMPNINKTVGDVKIVTDKNENRLRVIFPGKPSPEIISELKRNGFKWSPFNNAWQRMISNQSEYLAERIAEKASQQQKSGMQT